MAEDVSEGATSPWAARELYQVVLDQVDQHHWVVDVAATGALREAAVAARHRLAVFDDGEPLSARVEPDAPATRLLLALGLAVLDGAPTAFCLECRAVIAPHDVNYKAHCRFEELPLRQTNPYFLAGRTFLDVEFVLRRYFCPHCAVLLDVEVCQPGAEPFQDVALKQPEPAVSAV